GPTDKEENKNEIDPVERSRWFPFKNKMELVGSLSIGHTNSLVSCAIYNRNRVIMTVCDIQLSAWLTVRSAREGIHTFLKSQIKTETSPFGKPRIGSVQSLWEYHSRSRSKFYIHFNEFNELYSMREVSRTRTKQYVNVNEIEACINVQHNCDKGNCPIRKTKPSLIEHMVQCAVEGLENWVRNHFVFENPYAAADDKNDDGEEEDDADNINWNHE
ncbi:hypothetical protein PSHT_06306, partial [Puccinia striiformis]